MTTVRGAGWITVLTVALSGACSSATRDARPPGRDSGGEWQWVLVATLDNPGHSPAAERALEHLAEASHREGIR